MTWRISTWGLALLASLPSLGLGDEPAVPVSALDRAELKARVVAALSLQDRVAEIEPLWVAGIDTVAAIARSLAAVDPRAQAVLDGARLGVGETDLLQALVSDQAVPPLLTSNLALEAGRELARQRRLEDALAVLEQAAPLEVVDPAALHFYRAACHFHLHQRDETLASLDALAALPAVPTRYVTTAQRLRERIEPLEREKLDGIAHDMRDVERRLDLGRTDKPVQDLEEDILARLDKLIEDLEKQQQQSSGAAGANLAPSAPMDDSRLAGGQGEGKVDPKTFENDASWGGMQPRDREKVLNDIGREYPAHYRDAIEEYFRRLATQNGNR